MELLIINCRQFQLLPLESQNTGKSVISWSTLTTEISGQCGAHHYIFLVPALMLRMRRVLGYRELNGVTLPYLVQQLDVLMRVH